MSSVGTAGWSDSRAAQSTFVIEVSGSSKPAMTASSKVSQSRCSSPVEELAHGSGHPVEVPHGSHAFGDRPAPVVQEILDLLLRRHVAVGLCASVVGLNMVGASGAEGPSEGVQGCGPVRDSDRDVQRVGADDMCAPP